MARLFDGIDDVVNYGDIDALDGVAALTVACWVRPSSLGNNAVMVAKTTTIGPTVACWFLQTAISTGTSGYLVCGIGAFDFLTTTTLPLAAGRWAHVCMRFNGAGTGNAERGKLYVNGQLATASYNGTWGAATGSGTPAVTVGRFENAARPWAGDIADVRIWTAALTPGEILDLAHRTPGWVRDTQYAMPLGMAAEVETRTGAIGTVTGTWLSMDPPRLARPRHVFRRPPYAKPWLYQPHTSTLGAGFVRAL